MNKLALIALDGPSGVGKSTTARQLAQTLGWAYLDTGAMYRATALALLRAAVEISDRPALARALASLRIDQRGTRTLLGAEDVSELIRTPEVTRQVTPVSADPQVREVLVGQQRVIGSRGNWVVD
ncbi:MAG TPA: (d)CMP kinase, partial [Holophaga sp.]|nr:(d)CMP kinase [Holophaga sp.]